MKQISSHLEQKKEEEEKVEEADTAREEEEKGPGHPEGELRSPIRSWSPVPRRVTRSPEREGAEQDTVTITD